MSSRPRNFVPRWPPLIALLLVLSASAAATRPASAQSYLPLAVGNHWDYASLDGYHETQRITGTIELNGRTVFVKSYEQSTSNTGLENYWIEDANGRLLLCGYYISSPDSGGIVYEPPLCLVDAPLALGKNWTATVQAYRLPGMVPETPWQAQFEVLEAGDLVTPAGTFPASGVGQTQIFPTLLAGRSASGEAVGASAGKSAAVAPMDWYSPGVGVVQYNADAVYQLTGYGFPTAIVASTWGRLKSLYR
jgi:hypothetical protein